MRFYNIYHYKQQLIFGINNLEYFENFDIKMHLLISEQGIYGNIRINTETIH